MHRPCKAHPLSYRIQLYTLSVVASCHPEPIIIKYCILEDCEMQPHVTLLILGETMFQKNLDSFRVSSASRLVKNSPIQFSVVQTGIEVVTANLCPIR